MFIHRLGVAAGGGFPPWNCTCTGCRKARAKSEIATKHAATAISGDGEHWFLLNATPDVRHQTAADPSLHPGPQIGATPVAGVLLTDAEFDHTIGLLMLREESALTAYATYPVLEALTSWRHSRLSGPSAEWEVGFRLEDKATGGSVVYAPTLHPWDAEFAEQVASADRVFLDGTFWTDDEMSIHGARALAALPAKRKIYPHINNTNPILDEGSQERRWLTGLGIEIGRAGLEVEV
ncbi:MBL fold metallo-hydrolase [Prauserella cavernicola]|uniref:Pyrroloquinoline quinone biosynthesis protein B n=1 Tax=Prauserella cavernicola TaxID=2800127 RepID=A0A934V888_9PSEU|nr:MBL fold metallo-hydrolase [Prauserella cavernicola]MBK1789402.1 pyrroloquinoline quinone biosynthesis protein B [Prauserella cavernicola]